MTCWGALFRRVAPTGRSLERAIEILKDARLQVVIENYILKDDGFYISYNPNPVLGSGPETALVVGSIFLILDGDFRKEYEKRVHSFEECHKFFKDHLDKKRGEHHGATR